MTHSRRWPSSDTLDDLFVKHYGQMVARAQHLVGPDRQAAEDLVHDAYVRLALRRLDVSTVQNFESFMHVTLRNVHLSQVRRRMSKVTATVSIIDYESVVAGLRSIASGEERQAAYDALCHVVRYACLRKSSSKAAGVLILRFFHGYYPGEIARVMQTSEAAVASRLRLARAEARAYLADPGRLRSFEQRALPRVDARAQGDTESVAALRQAIFDAVSGACLSSRALDRLYAGPGAGQRRAERAAADPLDVTSLAHLVSCATCLDTINRRLGLPPLADRDPADRLGRGGLSDGHGDGYGGSGQGSGGRGRVGQGSGGSGGRGEGGRSADPAGMARTRLEDAREAQPQELQIAVNGLFVGAQAVYGPVNEQRLKILIPEQVGFIEIFDEHDTCLLYLDVEPPPSGAAEQSVRVSLSGGRQLSAALAFSDTSPTIHVVYENPSPAFERQALDVERVETPVHRGDEGSSPRRTWTFWPHAIRFVTVGIVLGVLLANPRRTLAAVDYVRRGVVDAVARLVESIRPRPVLPSRPIARPNEVYLSPRAIAGLPASAALPLSDARVSDIDLSELMLTTMRLLDDEGALTREQLRVERGPDDRVHVIGGVESETRRRELRDALRALPADHLRMHLATASDAARRPGPAPTPTSTHTATLTPGLMRSAELTRDRMPAAHEYVRRYFIARDTADRLPASAQGAAEPAAAQPASSERTRDAEVNDAARRFSAALLSRSLAARVSAATLRQIVFSVSPADAARLSPAASATWRGLIRRHAVSFRQETASLRGDLERIFPPSHSSSTLASAPASGTSSSPPQPDAWLIAHRIFDLASAHDLAVRRAFAVAADGSESLDVSTPAVRQSLLEAEQLADQLDHLK